MDQALHEACERVFRHPATPPPRRHGPRGYFDYQSYKPWLRDEFAFRCIYCLWRERWEADGQYGFGVEHVQPQSTVPERGLEYDNLIYACNMCNATRRDVPLPIDPSSDPPGRHVQIVGDGTVQALSPAGDDLIALCRLNRPLLVAARRRILSLIAVLRGSNAPESIEALHDLLACPAELPNLAALRPPDGNGRPEGIADSFFERHRRGAFADVY
jgi:hypothetical protein